MKLAASIRWPARQNRQDFSIDHTAWRFDPPLAEAHDRIRLAERRVTEIDDELATLRSEVVNEAEVSEALTGCGKPCRPANKPASLSL